MILLKVTYIEKGRQAISIDEFYYRGYESQLRDSRGTGVRRLARQMILEKKIISRNLILSENGDKLECLTIFKDRKSLEEYLNHELVEYSRNLWANRPWIKTKEIFELTDYKILS